MYKMIKSSWNARVRVSVECYATDSAALFITLPSLDITVFKPYFY